MEHQNSKTNAQLTANYSKKNNFYTENLRHKIRNEILSHDRTSPSKTPRRSRTTRFNWDEYEKKKEHTEMREVTNSKEQKNASTKNSPTTTKSTALDTSTELLNQARNRRKNSPKKFSQNNSAIGVNIRPTTREIQDLKEFHMNSNDFSSNSSQLRINKLKKKRSELENDVSKKLDNLKNELREIVEYNQDSCKCIEICRQFHPYSLE